MTGQGRDGLAAWQTPGWAGAPRLIASASGAGFPDFESAQIFAATVRCVDEHRRRGDQKVRLFIEGRPVAFADASERDLLPEARDGDFEAYDRRLRRSHQVGDFALVVADWHQFDQELWREICRAVAEISRSMGVSASRMDTQLFAGSYRKTPFGVHVDAVNAFQFPLVGKKTMRFWSDEFVQAHPQLKGARVYHDYLDASVAIEAVPGEVVYWPSDAWHIGEGDGALAVTWHFGHWVSPALQRAAGAALQSSLESAGALAMTALPTCTDGASDLSQLVEQVVTSASEAVRGDAFKQQIAKYVLEQVSGFGYLRFPAPQAVEPISPGASVALREPFRFVWAECGASLCVAIAGRSIELARDEAVLDAIYELNAAGPVNIDRISCGGLNRPVVDLLRLGVSTGALEILKA